MKNVETRTLNKIRFTLIKSGEMKKIAEQKRRYNDMPKAITEQMDPKLEIKFIVGKPPQLLAKFYQVAISLPRLIDATGRGAKHLKESPGYYLVGSNVVEVLPHFSHADIPVSVDGKFLGFTFKRVFYVPKSELGTTIIASIEVWRNNNGTLTINIFKSSGLAKHSIKMRPAKADEIENSKLFFSLNNMALEIIELKRKLAVKS